MPDRIPKRRNTSKPTRREVTRKKTKRTPASSRTAPGRPPAGAGPQPVEDRTSSSEQLLRAISCIQALFIDEAEPKALFQVLLQELLTLTASEYGFIGEVAWTAERQPYLRTHAITDVAWNEDTKALMAEKAPTLEFRNLQTLFGQVMTTGKPVIANDPANDPRAGGLPPGHPPIRSFLGLPFYRGELLMGMVGIANRPGGYDDALVTYLEPFLVTGGHMLEGYRNRRFRADAEAALRQSEERWQLAVQGSQDAIWDWDLTTDTVFYSARWKAVRDFEEQELTDSVNEWSNRIHPEDRARVLQAVESYLAKRVPEFREEYRVQRKDGSYRWVLARGSAIWNDQGVAIRMAGSESDITERKQAEQALLEANTAVELAMEGISRLDDAGRYVLVNQHYAALLGYRPEELVGQPWELTVHPDDRASVLTIFAEMLATGKAEADLRGVKKDGSVIWKHVVIVKPDGDGGKISGHYCFARDVTDRKRGEAIQAAEKQALELVAQGTALNEVLAFICRTIETHTAPMLCSVMLVTEDGAHLTVAAGPSLPKEYNQAVDHIPIGPTVGSCGSAAYFGTPSIVSDIVSHPLWKDYASVALPHGLKACWSYPIMSSTEAILGTFAAYYRDVREPSMSDLAVVERASRVAALAIEHVRMTEALQESEARFQAFMSYSPVVSFIKDEAGRHLYVNPSFERRFQVSFDQIRGKTNDELMPLAVAAELNENDRRVLSTGEVIEVEETVPTPDGQSKHWLVLKFPLKGARGESLLGGAAIDMTARKQAEEALRQAHEELEYRVAERTAALRRSEQSYAALVNNADGIILEYDPASARITFVSRQAERILGYPVEQWLDDPMFWLDHVHPEDRQWAFAYCQEKTKLGINHEFEYRMLAKDGRVVWIRDVVSLMYDDNGHLKLSCILLDVTKYKEMVEQLRLTQFSVDRAPNGIFWVSPTAEILYANDIACEILGYHRDELLGKTVHEIDPNFPPEIWPAHWAELKRSGSLTFDSTQRTKQGQIRYTEVTVNYLEYEGQEYNCAIVRDITERKQNEAALVESEERFSNAFNESPIGMAIVALDGRFLQVNEALCELVGHSKEELETMTFQAITHPDDLEKDLQYVQKILSGTVRTYHMEKRYLHKDGSDVWIVLNVSLVRNADGTPKHFVSQLQDITARKRLQEQRVRYTENLEQLVIERTTKIARLEAQRARTEQLAMIGQLAAGVAHEINNPIAGIKNAFQVVKEELPTDFPHSPFVGMIEREIDRVAAVVQQLYQLNPKGSDEVVTVNLETVVSDLSVLVASQLKQRRLTLTVEQAGLPGSISAPRGALQQILLNLLRNAIDAAPLDSVVTISLSANKQEVRISVVDQGQGIAPEVLPKIFEPFFTTKGGANSGGMGLGLSISHNLVQALGGRMEVHTQPGLGSTFTIIVPVPDLPAAASLSVQREESCQHGH